MPRAKKNIPVVDDNTVPVTPQTSGNMPLSSLPPMSDMNQPIATPTSPPPTQSYGGIGVKEKEIFAQRDEMQLEEIRKELEVAPEVAEAGVEVKSEEIKLPEDLKKMGVAQSDQNQIAKPPAGNLPIGDDKIITGLGAPVVLSLRWLVEWCVRQLKKVHVKLKKVHGQIVRVVTK